MVATKGINEDQVGVERILIEWLQAFRQETMRLNEDRAVRRKGREGEEGVTG